MGYPEFGCLDNFSKYATLRFKEKASAESIFTFENGKTVYLKNRFINPQDGYQFTEEEQLVIKLKAVPL